MSKAHSDVDFTSADLGWTSISGSSNGDAQHGSRLVLERLFHVNEMR